MGQFGQWLLAVTGCTAVVAMALLKCGMLRT